MGAWPVCARCNLPILPEGLGTALKPAHEPIVVARKPLVGTVAENVLAHGTGALNIDGCRVETTENLNGGAYAKEGGRTESQSLHGGTGMNVAGKTVGRDYVQPSGRWPANLIHDGSDEVLAEFPETKSGGYPPEGGQRSQVSTYGKPTARGEQKFTSSEGSAARFFYCAKASRKDRNDGTDDLPKRVGGMVSNTSGQHITRRDEGYEAKPQGNHHPTVKPTELMAYLVRLVTPPGGVVLDPFMGSGSTGKACMREGFQFIGCDLSADYAAIAKARIEHELRKLAPTSDPQKPGETLPLFEAEAA